MNEHEWKKLLEDLGMSIGDLKHNTVHLSKEDSSFMWRSMMLMKADIEDLEYQIKILKAKMAIIYRCNGSYYDLR